MDYFLVKTEPSEYSFDTLVKDGTVTWDGVRNYQARNNLKLMKTGDQVLVYHSVTDKEIVGIAEVTKEYYQDPTDQTNTWVVVDLSPLEKFKKTLSLEGLKSNKQLQDLPLIKQSRLSVMKITKKDFYAIKELCS